MAAALRIVSLLLNAKRVTFAAEILSNPALRKAKTFFAASLMRLFALALISKIAALLKEPAVITSSTILLEATFFSSALPVSALNISKAACFASSELKPDFSSFKILLTSDFI